MKGKTGLRTALTLIMAAAVSLTLVLAACGSGAATEEIDAVVQGVDGGEIILTLDDGTRLHVEAETKADDARGMIGEKVTAKIEVGDDNPKLVEIQKSSTSSSIMPGPEDYHFIGAVESIGAEAWIVGGKTFKVNSATMLDTGLAVGVEADVEFILLTDGTKLATKIETPASDDTVGDYSATGVITSLTATEVVLGDRSFKIDANTMLDNGLAVGVMARVEFVTQADGSFLAKEVETDAPASAAGEDFTAGGPIQSMDSTSLMVDGRKFAINASTILDSGLSQSVLVRVEFVIQPDGSLLAKSVETAGIDEGANLYFAGPIQSISPTAWVIGGKTFAVTPATMLDEGLAVGINANVEFIIKADGSFEAVHIEDSGFELIGMVQAIAPDAYAVGGHIFKTNAYTAIERGLKVGKLVQVKFIIQPGGSMLALQIKKADTKVQAFTFKGIVQSLSTTALTVTGQTFQLSPATAIGAGVTTGTEVVVTFDIQAGNVLKAISVQSAKAVRK